MRCNKITPNKSSYLEDSDANLSNSATFTQKCCQLGAEQWGVILKDLSLDFAPTFKNLEDLLALYKRATNAGQPARIQVNVRKSEYLGKMNPEFPVCEVWLTLDYALELMKREFLAKNCDVQVDLALQ